MEEIDFEALRKFLINYFGSAMGYNHVAIMDLVEVETAEDQKLIEIAIKNGIDLDDFIIEVSR